MPIPTQVTSQPNGANQLFVIPPAEKMEILSKLAMLGSIRQICQRAVDLESLDGKHIPFAHQIKYFAQNFHKNPLLP
jgi:hypothetical protein